MVDANKEIEAPKSPLELNFKEFDPKKITAEIMEFGAAVAPNLIPQDRLSRLSALFPDGFGNKGVVPGLKFEWRTVSRRPSDEAEKLALDLEVVINKDLNRNRKVPFLSWPTKRGNFEFSVYRANIYEPGSKLQPHYDADGDFVMTALVNIRGEADFVTYPHAKHGPTWVVESTEESDAHIIHVKPGDVVFMREQGWRGLDGRVCHAARNIKGSRAMLGYWSTNRPDSLA